MKIKLERLRALKVECDVIVQLHAVHVLSAGKIAKLGRLSGQGIEEEIGDTLVQIEGKKKLIIEEHREKFTDRLKALGDKKTDTEVSDDALPIETIQDIDRDFNQELSKDERFTELVELSKPLWDKEIEFNFIPVSIKKEDVYSNKLDNAAQIIEYKGVTHRVDPYLAFAELTSGEEQFIIIED